VVGGIIDCVDTNSVDAQLLELSDVTLAASLVGDRVSNLGGTSGLVVNTTNVKSLGSSVEGYLNT
jgi:hypothetical protein